MYFLRGVAIGIIIICQIIVWYSTETWRDFIFYSAFMHIFGMLSGIPGGLMIGNVLKKRKSKTKG
jgi:hypothetical protein